MGRDGDIIAADKRDVDAGFEAEAAQPSMAEMAMRSLPQMSAVGRWPRMKSSVTALFAGAARQEAFDLEVGIEGESGGVESSIMPCRVRWL